MEGNVTVKQRTVSLTKEFNFRLFTQQPWMYNDFELSHPHCIDLIISSEICINCMVRTQLYIFTQNSTLVIQLHVSTLYIGHRQVVL